MCKSTCQRFVMDKAVVHLIGRGISNPDLPSETSDHQREGGEQAAEETSMEACQRCECEVVFQFRCSVLNELQIV